jgi:hypothetical protein
MRTFFRVNNILLIVAMIGCCAGALAGLIVLFPFALGAWALNLVGLLGCEEDAKAERSQAVVREEPPARARESRASIPVTHGF